MLRNPTFRRNYFDPADRECIEIFNGQALLPPLIM